MNKKFIRTISTLTIATMAGMFSACGEDTTAGITIEDDGIADADISSSSAIEKNSSSSKKVNSSSSKNKTSSSSVSDKISSDAKSSSSIANDKISSDAKSSSSSVSDKISSDAKSSSSSKEEPKTYNGKVSGVSQKGPFLVGSSITLHELYNDIASFSGRSFPSTIKNDKGEFEISYKGLSSNYALLVAEGFYRNENTGKKSTAPIKLNALSDLSDRNTVNVNLLTHLEYDRVKHLINEKGVEYKDAKAQAEREILKAFNIDEIKDANAEDLSIFGKSDNDRALLALSVLMQGSSSEGEFSERLALIAQDLEKDGTIDDKQILTDIADEALWLVPNIIKQNILDWKISTDVPEFGDIVTKYWTTNYEIGDCTPEDIGKTAVIKNNLSVNYNKTFICDEFGSDKAIMWREITPNEVKYGNCSAKEEGNRFEDVLVCHEGKWENMAPEEKVGKCTEELYGETAIYENPASSYNGKSYVCDADGWRLMENFEKESGACTAAAADQHKTFAAPKQNIYLVCLEGKWASVTKDEFAQYAIECETEGEFKYSETTSRYYICKEGTAKPLAAEDLVVNKEFTADIWNGVTGEKATLIEGAKTTTFVGGNSVAIYNAKNEPVKTSNRTIFEDEEAEALFGSNGYSFGFTLQRGTGYADIGAGVGFKEEGGNIATFNATSLEGICAVYASSIPVTIYIDNLNEEALIAKFPASTELTVANVKWEEMELDLAKSADDVITKVKKIAVDVETRNSTETVSGVMYVGGIGKYNGCSIK